MAARFSALGREYSVLEIGRCELLQTRIATDRHRCSMSLSFRNSSVALFVSAPQSAGHRYPVSVAPGACPSPARSDTRPPIATDLRIRHRCCRCVQGTLAAVAAWLVTAGPAPIASSRASSQASCHSGPCRMCVGIAEANPANRILQHQRPQLTGQRTAYTQWVALVA